MVYGAQQIVTPEYPDCTLFELSPKYGEIQFVVVTYNDNLERTEIYHANENGRLVNYTPIMSYPSKLGKEILYLLGYNFFI